jgi:hypothetical protein
MGETSQNEIETYHTFIFYDRGYCSYFPGITIVCSRFKSYSLQRINGRLL